MNLIFDNTALLFATSNKNLFTVDIQTKRECQTTLIDPEAKSDSTGYYAASFSPNGQLIALVFTRPGDSVQSGIALGQTEEMFASGIAMHNPLDNISCHVDFSHYASQIIVGYESGTATIFTVNPENMLISSLNLLHGNTRITLVKFICNSTKAITASQSLIRFWDLRTQSLERQIYYRSDIPLALDISPDGKHIAIGFVRKHAQCDLVSFVIRILDIKTGVLLADSGYDMENVNLNDFFNKKLTVKFAPNNKFLFSALGNCLTIWALKI